MVDLNDIHLKHTGKARAARLFPVNKTNAMSTSVSQPNRRAECENARDLFFLKQWNWGGLPAATSTALGLPCAACSNLSPLETATFPAACSVPAGEGQEPSLGIPRCNTLPTGFCLHVPWTCRSRTRNLRFLRI